MSFTVRAQDLAFYTARGVVEVEPGEFSVWVGGDSRATERARFQVR